MICRGRSYRIAALLALLGTCVSGVGCQSAFLPLLPFGQNDARREKIAASLATAPSRRTASVHAVASSADVEATPLSGGVPVSVGYREPTRSEPPALIQTKAEETAPRKVAAGKPANLDVQPMVARAQPPRAEPILPPAEEALPAPRLQEGYVLPPDLVPRMAIPVAYPPDTVNPYPFAKRCSCDNCVGKLQRDVPTTSAPKEGQMRLAPPYVIETPDILLVEAPRSLPDQPISGEHLVRMDGTISLGLYGAIRVAGLTVDDAREAIERHLSQYIKEPKVNVDVYAYNSKFYYIIADGAGFGQQVIRLNFTGNDTVLSAISQISGLPSVASKKRIWIARPDPQNEKCGLVLPINWVAIAQCGETATNYQLFPGDRIYIQSDRLLALDGVLSKVITPIERVLGVSLLSAFAVSRYQNLGRLSGGAGGGF